MTRLTTNDRAKLTLAGLVIGQLIIFVLDAATGGPGPFVLFGL